MKKFAYLSLAAGLALSSSALAQFTSTAVGPIASADAIGSAENGVFGNTYTGGNTLFGSMGFSGDLTQVIPGTWASEARWNITNLGTGGSATFQPTTTTNFSGTINISGNANVLAWANTNDTVTFEAYETFSDGAGPDSVWSNVEFTFRGDVTPTFLGAFGRDIAIDTFGSSLDSELALYTAGGLLLANNDDTGGLQSQILATDLADGEYYIVVGGYNSGFGNGFAFPGAASGDYVLNIDGAELASGTLDAGSFGVYSFVVPSPSAAAFLGLGALMAGRRRRA